jgi:hypothetical protein
MGSVSRTGSSHISKYWVPFVFILKRLCGIVLLGLAKCVILGYVCRCLYLCLNVILLAWK